MLGSPVGLSDVQDEGFLCGVGLPSKQRLLPELHQLRLYSYKAKQNISEICSQYILCNFKALAADSEGRDFVMIIFFSLQVWQAFW